MKVALKQHRNPDDERYQFLNWKSCLPFVENKRGVLIHRPRSVVTVAKSVVSRTPYVCVDMWCGNRTVGGDYTFLASPPNGKVVCARCEAIAIESGQQSSDNLAGHHVHIGGVRAVITCCPDTNEIVRDK